VAPGNLQLNTYFGPYFLVKLIAVGGMAEIYLARTKGVAGFEKQLALKVIHPDYADDKTFVEMLVNEAKIAVKLNHHNIAQTFDLGRINNCYFISMEFVDGADFFQILRRLTDVNSSLPVEAAVFVAHEALQGLEYAHTKSDENGQPLKIVHRDMSPQNILLSRHGEVKIVDFGIAKAANLTNKTRAGVIKGKLVYMSPEQAWGDPIDQRTDVFSMGIVLYEALTGGSLYLEKNPVKLLEMVRKAEIKPPSSKRREVPGELDAIVMKALQPRPADRFQTAREYAAALAEFLHRTAPGYTDQQLGTLVDTVLAGGRPKRPTKISAEDQKMVRDDFAVGQHSMIFSAEDMLASSPVLPPPPPQLQPPTGPRAPVSPSARAATHPPAAHRGPPSPPPTGPVRAKLLLLENEEAKPFTLGEEFVIGRSGDLRLGDARVSRRHARIVHRDPSSYLLEDLGSANGTFLNEEKLSQPTLLRTGDMIRVGPFEMRFVIEEVSAPSTKAPVLSPALAPVSPSAQPLEPAQTPPGEPPPSPRSHASPPRVSPHDRTEDAQAQRSDGARLVVALGNEHLSLPIGVELPLSHSFAVGSTRLRGQAISVVKRPDGYWLEPTEAGGVLLNGKPVTAPALLSAGDLLQVGPLELEFQI
jgi:serine/threonine protein kinase